MKSVMNRTVLDRFHWQCPSSVIDKTGFLRSDESVTFVIETALKLNGINANELN